MTKEKWFEIYDEEIKKSLKSSEDTIFSDPEDWFELSKPIRKVIEVMDKVTEIYNLENQES